VLLVGKQQYCKVLGLPSRYLGQAIPMNNVIAVAVWWLTCESGTALGLYLPSSA
jgi:hypothetical protein